MSVTTIIHCVGPAWPELCRDPFCPLCGGADRPLDGRGNTSLTLVGGPLREPAWCLDIDCGQGRHHGRRRALLPLPGALLVTHWHRDHLNLMELDTLARESRGAPSGPVRVVTSAATWAEIPPYLQGKFRHTAVEAGQELRLPLGSSEVTVAAIDASDHCPGGLVYSLTFPGFRFGALFDVRSWSAVRPDQLENLDLAVLAGNELWPLADRTGHASIPESLAFLAALRRPPRLVLLTHYGHDDPELFTMGSLVAVFAGLAPHLNVRVAHKGMTVASDSLPPRNPVAVLDRGSGLPIRAVEKSAAHEQGLLHASTLILVRPTPGKLLVYERHSGQSYPGCLDAFGGHVQPADRADPGLAALREAREEVQLFSADGHRVHLPEGCLSRLSAPHALESHEPKNRELSTVFGLAIPAGLSVRAFDELDDGTEVELETRPMSLADLETLFKASPGAVADGLSRVLRGITEDPTLRAQVESFVTGN